MGFSKTHFTKTHQLYLTIKRNQLLCKLTLKHVNKQPDHIQLHFNGRRFKKAYQHCMLAFTIYSHSMHLASS